MSQDNGAPLETLVGFLYTLLRDEVLPGTLERLVQDVEKHPPPYQYTNPHLAAYARSLAQRLIKQGQDRLLDDGFGNVWEKCSRPDCQLQIVRPGKVQCDPCEARRNEYMLDDEP